MLSKDFENLELRLQKIREESEDIFRASEEAYREAFEGLMERVFPRDILGVKKTVAALWQIDYADAVKDGKEPDSMRIFDTNIWKVIATLPLQAENKQELHHSLKSVANIPAPLRERYFGKDTFKRDPLFPIIEWLLNEWDISPEEYTIIEDSYLQFWNILDAISSLPENIRNMVHEDVSAYSHGSEWEKEEMFHGEYYKELDTLHGAGYDIFPVRRFLAKSYFKNPGRLRKRESYDRRLRRTFKMALLRILKMRFGSIDAEKLMQEFDQCETFQEMFLLIYRLFEVLGENDENKESFQLLEESFIIEKIVFTAEETKEKILEWEKITADISSLIGDTDAELEEGVLERILDDDTHFHGDEILFSHWEDDEDMAWAYSEASRGEEAEDEEEQEIIQWGDTLSGKYQALKEHFHKVDEDKRKAFLEWEYDKVDEINQRLVSVQSKIEKIAKLLWEEV